LIKYAGALVSMDKSLNLDYVEQSPSNLRRLASIEAKSSNLSCISKMPSGWNPSNCQLQYTTKQRSFTCICDEARPTTIVENLENLILNK